MHAAVYINRKNLWIFDWALPFTARGRHLPANRRLAHPRSKTSHQVRNAKVQAGGNGLDIS